MIYEYLHSSLFENSEQSVAIGNCKLQKWNKISLRGHKKYWNAGIRRELYTEMQLLGIFIGHLLDTDEKISSSNDKVVITRRCMSSRKATNENGTLFSKLGAEQAVDENIDRRVEDEKEVADTDEDQ